MATSCLLGTHGVRDPALRAILGNADLWTPGDDVAQWHRVSEEEFIYVLEQFLDNVDRFYGGLFRKGDRIDLQELLK
eukprot:COSAG01_NODE_28501_length_659_cov_2.046429_1_plen_77_part_00